jgi:hypothetical protein
MLQDAPGARAPTPQIAIVTEQFAHCHVQHVSNCARDGANESLGLYIGGETIDPQAPFPRRSQRGTDGARFRISSVAFLALHLSSLTRS